MLAGLRIQRPGLCLTQHTCLLLSMQVVYSIVGKCANSYIPPRAGSAETRSHSGSRIPLNYIAQEPSVAQDYLNIDAQFFFFVFFQSERISIQALPEGAPCAGAIKNRGSEEESKARTRSVTSEWQAFKNWHLLFWVKGLIAVLTGV